MCHSAGSLKNVKMSKELNREPGLGNYLFTQRRFAWWHFIKDSNWFEKERKHWWVCMSLCVCLCVSSHSILKAEDKMEYFLLFELPFVALCIILHLCVYILCKMQSTVIITGLGRIDHLHYSLMGTGKLQPLLPLLYH